MTNFQRKGAISNAHVGREFEKRARAALAEQGLNLDFNHKVAVGITSLKKEHAFDLGSENPKDYCRVQGTNLDRGKQGP